MIDTSSSSQNCYLQPAIGEFPWSKHKHKTRALTSQLTITPALTAIVQRETATHVGITLQFNGPIAGLDKPPISDKFNQGPYMDIMTYCFKPEGHTSVCRFDSAGGTPAKKATSTLQNNHGLMFGLNPVGGQQGGLPLLQAAGLINFMNNVTKTQQTESDEFEQKQYLNGLEKRITYSMTRCYSGDEIVKYDPCKLNSLRHSEHGTRIGLGFIPFFGWFGGWQVVPDTLHTLPDTANSAISGNWALEYAVDKNVNHVDFEWTIEVRTVFASNDKEVADHGCCNDRLNWIATIHQVTYLINIQLALPDITLKVTERGRRLMCATGFEGKTKEIKYSNDSAPLKANTAKKVQKYFNTQIKPKKN